MSKISISCEHATDSLDCAKILHDVLNFSYKSAKLFLGKGKAGVFFTCELFLNDHLEKEALIRTLVTRFKEVGAELFVMEIGPHDSWTKVVNFDAHRIATSELLAELDRNKGKFQ